MGLWDWITGGASAAAEKENKQAQGAATGAGTTPLATAVNPSTVSTVIPQGPSGKAAAGTVPTRPESSGVLPETERPTQVGEWVRTDLGDNRSLWTNTAAQTNKGNGTTAKKEEAPLDPAAEMWQSSYAPSQNVLDAQAYLRQQEQAIANKGPYTGSPYDQDIASAYSAIMGRGPFRYDVNGDALYQQYRDLYAENGRQASLNAMGQAAGLTGGYGNSYAAAAGNAAYDQYMGQLNDRALDIYDRARQRWLDEGDLLQTQYGAARDMGDLDYSRWVDDYNRMQQERNYAYGKYGDEFTRDYGMYKDEQQLAYDQVIAMIQKGVTPSAQMRRNAGISDEDYLNLKKTYKKKTSGGSTYKGPSVTRDFGYDPNVLQPSTGTGTGTETTKSNVEQMASYLNGLVDNNLISPETALQVAAAMSGVKLPG